LKGEVVRFKIGAFDRLLVCKIFGIYEGLVVGEIVELVLGNVIGGVLESIVFSFVGENVGNENVRLLVGCTVNDEIVVNEMIGNIDGIRVEVSVGVVIGFSIRLFGGLDAVEFVRIYERLFLGEFVGTRVGVFVRVVDRN
jgi:hypothetical protein